MNEFDEIIDNAPDTPFAIGIVGSRDFPELHRVMDLVSRLPAHATVVSGGARGVDSAAEQAAKLCGLATDIREPEWNRWGKYLAPKIRNSEIVDASCILVAFQFRGSGGTQDAIDKAYRKGIPVRIYT